MIHTVLFVCIGNICRSPMAEGLFRRALPAVQVCSAGIQAVVGAPADPIAVALLKEKGVDIGAHRAQNLSGWMVKEADLIVTMDQEQARVIANAHPASKGKLIRLGEAGRYDVPDPYQHGEAAFRHACGLITWGIDELVGRIAMLEASEAVPRHDTYPQIPAPKALGFFRPSVSM